MVGPPWRSSHDPVSFAKTRSGPGTGGVVAFAGGRYRVLGAINAGERVAVTNCDPMLERFAGRAVLQRRPSRRSASVLSRRNPEPVAFSLLSDEMDFVGTKRFETVRDVEAKLRQMTRHRMQVLVMPKNFRSGCIRFDSRSRHKTLGTLAYMARSVIGGVVRRSGIMAALVHARQTPEVARQKFESSSALPRVGGRPRRTACTRSRRTHRAAWRPPKP